MRHRKVQKCIQLFNAMSMVFVQYENIYHDAWYNFAGQVRARYEQTVLFRCKFLDVFLGETLPDFAHPVQTRQD